MPFNPAGIFSRLYNWVQDRDLGIKILAPKMDDEFDNIVSGINSITSGEQPIRGPIKVPYGTAAAPGFTFDGDENTGIFRQAPDQVALTAGGSAGLRVTATGVSMLAPLNMGGQKATNILAATLPGDVPRFDQIVPASGGRFTGTVSVPSGSRASLGVQFGATGDGLYWYSGIGPGFVADGADIGVLTAGTALPYPVSVVTRGAGDARYALQSRAISLGDGLTGDGPSDLSADRTIRVDSTVMRTNSAQVISGMKTHTANVVFNSHQQSVYFDADAATRQAMYFRRSGVQWTVNLLADNRLEFLGAGANALRVSAPMHLNLGDGDVMLENNVNDGDGAGLCVRTSANPTTGMVFSVRRSGSDLGLGVHASKVTTSGTDIYVNTSSSGAGGDRVLHVGIVAGGIGSYALLRLSPGGSAGPNQIIPASAFDGFSSTSGDSVSGTPIGTWRCLGRASGGSNGDRTTLFWRVE